jgi:hypothetical protein
MAGFVLQISVDIHLVGIFWRRTEGWNKKFRLVFACNQEGNLTPKGEVE